MGVSSRTVTITLIYKKGDKEDIVNYRPIYLLNLPYTVCTTILKNHMSETLDAVIAESKSAAKKKKLYCTHFPSYMT